MKKTYSTLTLVMLIAFIVLSFNLTGQTKQYKLQMMTGSFIPAENAESFDPQKNIQSNEILDERIYRIIQFYNIPLQEQKEELVSAGWHFLGYIPSYAYIVSLPSNINSNDLVQAKARSIFKESVKMKIHPDLALGLYPGYATPDNKHVDVILKFYDDLSEKHISELIQMHGILLLSEMDYPHTRAVRIKRDDLENVAMLPFVSWIEAIPDIPQHDNYTGRTLHRSTTIDVEYGGGRNYDGTGVHVMLQDDGFIGPHIDYEGRVISEDNIFNGPSQHGDHTSGTIMGAGNLDPRFRGMAPGSILHNYDVRNTSPYYMGFADLQNAYMNKGVRISSTSYSNGCNAGYTFLAQSLDESSYLLPSLLHVFSAGNSGTSNCGYGAGFYWGNITGGHKIGKNVMAVANLNSQDGLATSSSRGPAHDGRIKPDVGAKGSSVTSTQEDNTYASKSGTSMSCPGVSGTIAQLYHAFKETHGGNDPNGGLMKAIVMNSADDIYNAGPDYKTGWGRINALRAAKTIEEDRFYNDSITQNEIKTDTLLVPAGIEELRVMVYWVDYQGVINTTKALVNDLDMKITDPSSTVYDPWVLDPTPNATTLNLPAVRGIDTLNNVEQVTILNPVSGTYTISINGKVVPQGPQEYFIVYEFITDEVEVTYPVGGEGFDRGESVMLRWDAFGDQGTFIIEYSHNNGLSWSTAGSVQGNYRSWVWVAPQQVSDRALIRVSRGGKSGTSDETFTIIDIPINLSIGWACPDSFMVTWDSVYYAEMYEVSVLGNMYMDSAGRTTSNQFVVKNYSSADTAWVSVRIIGSNGGKGRRAVAIMKAPGAFNCVYPKDLAIKVVGPAAGIHYDCFNGNNLPVMVEIINTGMYEVAGFDISYTYNGSNPVVESYTDTIAAGSSIVKSFSQTIDLVNTGSNYLLATVSSTQDSNSANNTHSAHIELLSEPAVIPIHIEDIESLSLCSGASFCELVECPLGAEWKNEKNTDIDNIDWRTAKGSTPSGGTGPDGDHTIGAGGKFLYLEASGECFEKEALLVSPCIDLSQSQEPVFEFWYNMYGTEMGDLHVDIMTEHYWIEDVITPHTGNQGNSWHRQVIDLMPYKGGHIVLRFRGITGDGNKSDMALDDFTIGEVSAIEEISKYAQLKVYPNPSGGIFYIDISGIEEEILNMEVFNSIGMKVLTEKPSNGDSEIKIDLSDNPAGLYFLYIRSENNKYFQKLHLN